ncbi:MAG: hypothetical protein ACHQJ6_00245 [Candidatus Berkiellales bacterium]
MKKGTDVKKAAEDLLRTARDGTARQLEELMLLTRDKEVLNQAASIVVPPENQTLLMLAVSSGDLEKVRLAIVMYEQYSRKLNEHIDLISTKHKLNILQMASLVQSPDTPRMVKIVTDLILKTDPKGGLLNFMLRHQAVGSNPYFTGALFPERGYLYAIYKNKDHNPIAPGNLNIIKEQITKIFKDVKPDDIVEFIGGLLDEPNWLAHALGKDKPTAADMKNIDLQKDIAVHAINSRLPALLELESFAIFIPNILVGYKKKHPQLPVSSLNLSLSKLSQSGTAAQVARSRSTSTSSESSTAPQSARSRSTSTSSQKSASATSSSSRSRSGSAPAQPPSASIPSRARSQTPPPAKAPQPSQGGPRVLAVSSSSESSSSSSSDQVFDLPLPASMSQKPPAASAATPFAGRARAQPAVPPAGRAGARPALPPTGSAGTPARPQAAAPAAPPAMRARAQPAVPPAGRAAAPVVPPVRPQAPPPPDPTQTMTTTMAQTHNPSQAVSAAVTTYMKTHQNKAPNQGELNTMARQATTDPQERDKLLLAIRSRFKK